MARPGQDGTKSFPYFRIVQIYRDIFRSSFVRQTQSYSCWTECLQHYVQVQSAHNESSLQIAALISLLLSTWLENLTH
eukprot:scaffold6638_cov127-Cylindrotheca_fusiformis.AAC.35